METLPATVRPDAPESPARHRADIHDSPWVTLAYLFFVFLPILFGPWGWQQALLASLASVLVFLPLHFRFYRGDPAARPWLVLAVAAIGWATIPFNPGGNTFLIYACGMAGWSFRPRRAVGVSLVLVLLTVALFLVVMPLRYALAWSVMATLISLLVMWSSIHSRLQGQRDAELRLTQAEVGRLAAMAERERIGRDLHDLLGHTLSVVALKSELAGRLVERDPAAARVQMAEVETVARQALAQVREAVVGIRATGLQAELAAARLALLSADVRLDQQLAPATLPPAAELALAMGLREAVTNVVRHAQAHRVEVELSTGQGGVRLAISDDGRGGVGREGTGLTGMRERLAALGGRLDIDSPPGGGTRLVLQLPPAALEGPAA